MFVYVLYTTWTNPDDEGSEIQVFSEEHLEDARAAMRKNAADIRRCYHDDRLGEDPWEDDYTWEEDNNISMGFCDQPFGLATIYTWEIEPLEVK